MQGDHGNDLDFLTLKRRIFRDTSLDCRQYKDNYLKRRLHVRMRARGAGTYAEYLAVLTREPGEYDALLKDITINVTQFFRDPQVFAAFEEDVLPFLIYEKVRANRSVIRFWSAGCSSGEEPYSLAILLRDMLGEEFHRFQASVHATDIDAGSLAVARRGEYPPRQLENVRPDLLARYFTFNGQTYRVADEVRDMVRFRNQDLFADRKGSHFDVVFCRNVVIYFTKDMQDRLYMEFYDALNKGGYLVLGRTETLIGEARDRFAIVNGRERIYQKTETS